MRSDRNNRMNSGKKREGGYHCGGFRRRRRSDAEDSKIAIWRENGLVNFAVDAQNYPNGQYIYARTSFLRFKRTITTLDNYDHFEMA